MGSFFSSAETDSNKPEAPAVGNVRPRTSDDQQPAQEPPKRRRKEKKKAKMDRAAAPPTRAMRAQRERSDQNNGTANDEKLRPKRRKRKVAVFLGYVGEKYYGMQINPDVITIEQVLLTAFNRAGLISNENKDSLPKISWMRAARTDKGVSAAGQCVSAKLECEVEDSIDPALVNAINDHLPEDVEVFGMLRATGGFNARGDCHRRRYEYMFPVRLLGGPNGTQTEREQGAGDPRCARLSAILRKYEGTHCFANFTDGLSGRDDAARRYMIRVQCGQPFLPPNSGVYYVTVEIYGQSFLLHQIRKMVGLALFVYLGHAPEEVIPVALCPHVKLPTPMAPALGLLLDSLIFEHYNSRHGHVLELPISADAFAQSKEDFKLNRIYNKIAERERNERILETWVKTSNQKLQYKAEEIAELHKKFVVTDEGREEQRRAHIASLYPIRTGLKTFLDCENDKALWLADELKATFRRRYGIEASFLARAPGRVTLIGEHLDYNGLPVISTATTQGTMVAGCLDDTEIIEVGHLESAKYAAGQLRASGVRMSIDTNGKGTDVDENWLQYVSWGVKALMGSLNASKRTVKGGGRLLVGGDLPRAGGLASSSSLVTVAALVAARLNRRRIPKQELALHAAKGERLGAGTKGGALDHTTCMCGVRGGALQISFTPDLGITEFSIPDGASLVAVDSGVTAEKGFDDQVKRQFNLRAAECRIGAAILARRLNVHLSKSVTTPGQLLFQARKTAVLGCRSISALRRKSNLVMKPDETFVLDEVGRELNVSDVELRTRFLAGVEADKFEVGKRMTHVFSETERVERFARLLRDDCIADGEKLEKLGKILNEGHASLRDLFESSCTEVDRLVQFCLESGAVGSRMTGAGWGGYTINLVPAERRVQFLDKVVARVGRASVLEVEPGSGACIYAIHTSYGRQEFERKGTGRSAEGPTASREIKGNVSFKSELEAETLRT